MMPPLRFALALLLLFPIAACVKATSGALEELIAPRPQYDVSRPFEKLVKPHFYARSTQGQRVEIQGVPNLILEVGGKVKIRLRNGEQEQTLDPLALEPVLLGEHPVHKIYRLRAMGVPIADGLEKKLRPASFDQGLFHTILFEYLPGKNASGIVAEVFPDGTFLVIPYQTPLEWQSNDVSIASPTHFHVNPRAMSVQRSSTARRFEKEILALPFEEQRYPQASLAKEECAVYDESLQVKEYTGLLSSVGFKFTPSHVLGDQDQFAPFGEKLSLMLRNGLGEKARYFGYEGYWVADLLRGLQVSWIKDCDTAGQLLRYRPKDRPQEDFYITIRRSLEPDKKRRYQIISMDREGSGQAIYTAPGIMLMAYPLPSDDGYWIMSAEGWKPPDPTGPPDLRWQSVYVVNVKHPDEYRIVEYPVYRYPQAPKQGRLYGSSPFRSSDGRYLFNLLYGFREEGGGMWVADSSEENFYTKADRFARVVAWDHMLSWIVLKEEKDEPGSSLYIFATGKEVAEDFAMTANFLQIRNTGLDSSVQRQQRLLRMVGWNPVPFAYQRISENQFRVAVTTHFNYEGSLLPRATGVYFVQVDTVGTQ